MKNLLANDILNQWYLKSLTRDADIPAFCNETSFTRFNDKVKYNIMKNIENLS